MRSILAIIALTGALGGLWLAARLGADGERSAEVPSVQLAARSEPLAISPAQTERSQARAEAPPAVSPPAEEIEGPEDLSARDSGMAWVLPGREAPGDSGSSSLQAETQRPQESQQGDALAASHDAGVEESPSPSRNPRFRVAWDSPGHCPTADARTLAANRTALLETFEPVQVAGVTLRRAPGTSWDALREIAQALNLTRDIAANLLDWRRDAAPPAVFVYASLQSMREVACVSPQTMGYFDGAIHLSGSPDDGLFTIRETAMHEYTHYVLRSLGIKTPMWLHEGLAMHFAGESWWRGEQQQRLDRAMKEAHLPFDALTFASPHTSDELFATASYYQSYRMVTFLLERRGTEILRALIRDLAGGQVLPAEAFERASGVSPSQLETVWRQYFEGEI